MKEALNKSANIWCFLAKIIFKFSRKNNIISPNMIIIIQYRPLTKYKHCCPSMYRRCRGMSVYASMSKVINDNSFSLSSYYMPGIMWGTFQTSPLVLQQCKVEITSTICTGEQMEKDVLGNLSVPGLKLLSDSRARSPFTRRQTIILTAFLIHTECRCYVKNLEHKIKHIHAPFGFYFLQKCSHFILCQ